MRQCLLLRCQGFKYREIARLLGIRADTVKKQLAVGRRRLRPLLGSVSLLGSVALLGGVSLLLGSVGGLLAALWSPGFDS